MVHLKIFEDEYMGDLEEKVNIFYKNAEINHIKIIHSTGNKTGSGINTSYAVFVWYKNE